MSITTPLADVYTPDSAPAPAPTRDPRAEAAMLRRVGLWAVIQEDYRQHRRRFFKPGFQALLSHRLGVYATTLRGPLRLALSLVARIGTLISRNVYGIEMQPTVCIGRRLTIGHQHGIVIHKYATIGDDCLIRQGVTFGIGREFTEGRGPVIGNRVEFGVGSVVVGDLTIGDDVIVGPNCVVMRDVPPNSSLFMPPPRMLRREPVDPALEPTPETGRA